MSQCTVELMEIYAGSAPLPFRSASLPLPLMLILSLLSSKPVYVATLLSERMARETPSGAP